LSSCVVSFPPTPLVNKAIHSKSVTCFAPNRQCATFQIPSPDKLLPLRLPFHQILNNGKTGRNFQNE
jgi:hypothetical protein